MYNKMIRTVDRYQWIWRNTERALQMMQSMPRTDFEQAVDAEIEASRAAAREERDGWLKEELALIRGKR